MDLKLSYSKISSYMQCPYKYYLAYIVKLPTEPKPYFSFGHSLHKILEWLHKPKIFSSTISVDEILREYNNCWVSMGFTSIDEEARYKEIGRSILISYWDKMNGNFHPAFEVEKRFSFEPDELPGVTLTGIIDRIDLTESGELTLMDYKTGKWIPSDADAMDTLQLTIYAIAVSRLWGKPVSRVSNLFLREQKEVSFVPDEHRMKQAMNEIVDVIDGIRNKRFETKTNRFCNWCDYHNRCKTTSVLSVER
ncbi:MAG: PD-(D/E)XK nuclease family protein [Caldisericia bacterium]|nr:PD-(D/E)XK nuclease family protein [Caldisericia bacterium]